MDIKDKKEEKVMNKESKEFSCNTNSNTETISASNSTSRMGECEQNFEKNKTTIKKSKNPFEKTKRIILGLLKKKEKNKQNNNNNIKTAVNSTDNNKNNKPNSNESKIDNYQKINHKLTDDSPLQSSISHHASNSSITLNKNTSQISLTTEKRKPKKVTDRIKGFFKKSVSGKRKIRKPKRKDLNISKTDSKDNSGNSNQKYALIFDNQKDLQEFSVLINSSCSRVDSKNETKDNSSVEYAIIYDNKNALEEISVLDSSSIKTESKDKFKNYNKRYAILFDSQEILEEFKKLKLEDNLKKENMIKENQELNLCSNSSSSSSSSSEVKSNSTESVDSNLTDDDSKPIVTKEITPTEDSIPTVTEKIALAEDLIPTVTKKITLTEDSRLSEIKEITFMEDSNLSENNSQKYALILENQKDFQEFSNLIDSSCSQVDSKNETKDNSSVEYAIIYDNKNDLEDISVLDSSSIKTESKDKFKNCNKRFAILFDSQEILEEFKKLKLEDNLKKENMIKENQELNLCSSSSSSSEVKSNFTESVDSNLTDDDSKPTVTKEITSTEDSKPTVTKEITPTEDSIPTVIKKITLTEDSRLSEIKEITFMEDSNLSENNSHKYALILENQKDFQEFSKLIDSSLSRVDSKNETKDNSSVEYAIIYDNKNDLEDISVLDSSSIKTESKDKFKNCNKRFAILFDNQEILKEFKKLKLEDNLKKENMIKESQELNLCPSSSSEVKSNSTESTPTEDLSLSVTKEISLTEDSSLSVTKEISLTEDSSLSVTKEISLTEDSSLSVTKEISLTKDSSLSVTKELAFTEDSKLSETKEISLSENSESSESTEATTNELCLPEAKDSSLTEGKELSPLELEAKKSWEDVDSDDLSSNQAYSKYKNKYGNRRHAMINFLTI
ncbi:hypothetical protein H8356DRAFT_1082759 [Neocallimastix lanati (nom. inval.)]|uniref:Uncharacterized protein n=1 Tax=Neocallimastix californiae TaxID=1754190 RepID=A0A1Y2AYP7_9FUNG|nr:hypothetical protein H8356DRAFT_1082759 [Neocallimastix sp. JGI-2020a]ORY27698.1 hypothetical protein LY90DRAFT_705855 [Neocallimastix californiae]|eukprot:ORY27698.1 hypothetical protein LY90DRAFT_705855 [Neocallimastix californiae]